VLVLGVLAGLMRVTALGAVLAAVAAFLYYVVPFGYTVFWCAEHSPKPSIPLVVDCVETDGKFEQHYNTGVRYGPTVKHEWTAEEIADPARVTDAQLRYMKDADLSRMSPQAQKAVGERLKSMGY
jgi:hypothetical protein